MKFLYLKGLEVLGPTEVEQLLKESWFSDEVLVCPEGKGEQESAWKIAKDYPEFKKSLEKEIFPAQENKPQENQPQENKQQAEQPKPAPAVAPVPPAAPVIKEEKPQPPAQPVEPIIPPAKQDTLQNKIKDLPPLENTETESETDLKKKEEPKPQGAVVEEVSAEVAAPLVLDDPQDHTFRIPQKEDDNLLEDLPSESIFAHSEETDKTPAEEGEKAPDAPITDLIKKENAVDHTSPVANEPLPLHEEDTSAVNKPTFLEISNNKIISSSDGRVQKEKKNDLIFILSFIAIVIISIAVCLAFFNKKEDKIINTPKFEQEEEQQPQAAEQEQTQDNSFEPEREETSPAEVASATSAENETINIVKNTMLKKKGRTIGEYFNEVYGADYQTSWSAKPFTDNIYIVEFFASQVRNEPFVYLFRVDTEKQKITGALNNITLDLIG